ncbi:MAG: stage V sporulation protein AD [Oscillospiraceae bacterium]
MAIKQGQYTFYLPTKPAIIGCAAVVGKKEGEGPLASEFDCIFDDATLGEDSWEKAESAIHKDAVMRAMAKAQKTPAQIDMIFSGDLLDQCIGTTFSIKELNIPFAGLYGACSTMALSLAIAGLLTDSGVINTAVAATSSHFCSAEKQFRQPLEYGGQRPPSAQWTVTGAGAAVVQKGTQGVCIEAVQIGRIQDKGIKDANNMGAAMAPAAAETIATFLTDTGTTPEDYDMILTGDLGKVGTTLLLELLNLEKGIDISGVHSDCGIMMFDCEEQDVNSGGSGCGCSGSIVCSHIFNRLTQKSLNKVLFVGTGALMSPVSSLQGASIPSIAHAVLLTSGG